MTHLDTRTLTRSRQYASCVHDRIPGGAASGKIISYKLTGDGSSGQFLTDVRIGVAVGKGASAITPDAGMNSYADGYVQSGYAISTGAVFPIGQADLGYSPITIPTNDMSLNTAINTVWEFQQISTAHPFYKAALSLTVPDIANRSFSTLYEVLATNLCVPQGIDLGAANVS